MSREVRLNEFLAIREEAMTRRDQMTGAVPSEVIKKIFDFAESLSDEELRQIVHNLAETCMNHLNGEDFTKARAAGALLVALKPIRAKRGMIRRKRDGK